jgi:hypothetical protein
MLFGVRQIKIIKQGRIGVQLNGVQCNRMGYKLPATDAGHQTVINVGKMMKNFHYCTSLIFGGNVERCSVSCLLN